MEKIVPEGATLKDKVVYINRVAKVVKGGRRFSFTALEGLNDSLSIDLIRLLILLSSFSASSFR